MEPAEAARQQEGYGGWDEEMLECLGEEGIVTAYSMGEEDGLWSIEVTCTSSSGQYEWSPASLREVETGRPLDASSGAEEQVPQGQLAVGEQVAVEDGSVWFAAKVTRLGPGGTCDVESTDGRKEENLPRARIARVGRPGTPQEPLPEPLAEGSVVRILDDLEKVQELQKGNWDDSMKGCLGELGFVSNLRGNQAEVVCPSVSQRAHLWSLLCLKPEPTEALYCLDLHDHALLWCGNFPNCHTCDADCDRRRIWEAFRCPKCDFDVCAQCAEPYKPEEQAQRILRSRRQLLPLVPVGLPRGMRSSRWPCCGELLPGGCRNPSRDSATFGGCCASSKFLICDSCMAADDLGECNLESRSKDLNDLPSSTARIAACLSLHPSEIFALADAGLFTCLAECLGTAPAARELTLELGAWLAAGAPREAAAGPVLVELSEGVWGEAHVLAPVATMPLAAEGGEKAEDIPPSDECFIALHFLEACVGSEPDTQGHVLKAKLSNLRSAFGAQAVGSTKSSSSSSAPCGRRDNAAAREQLVKELRKGTKCAERTVQRLLGTHADLLLPASLGAGQSQDAEQSQDEADGLIALALRSGCPMRVLEDLLLAWAPVLPEAIEAAAPALQAEGAEASNGVSGQSLAGFLAEPRLASLFAERGGRWAQRAAEACRAAAAAAELEVSAAKAKLSELEVAAEQRREELRLKAEAEAAIMAELANTSDAKQAYEALAAEEAAASTEEDRSVAEGSAEPPAAEAVDAQSSEDVCRDVVEDMVAAAEAECRQREEQRARQEEAERKKAEQARKEAEAAEVARRERAEARALSAAALAVSQAEAQVAAATACAAACVRLAGPRPTGCWASLLQRFSTELLAPLLEAEDGKKAAFQELDGKFGSWLGALMQAGCCLTQAQVERLAARVATRLAEAAGPSLQAAMAFVECLLDALPSQSMDQEVSRLAAAFRRHGAAALLERLAAPGAVVRPPSAAVIASTRQRPGGETPALGALCETAQRLASRLRADQDSNAANLAAENSEVAKLVTELSEPTSLGKLADMLRSGACTPYELAVHGLPSRLLPMLSTPCEWPWGASSAATIDDEMLEALLPALQWLLGLCETLPVAAAEGRSSGLDCLVRPLELTLERGEETPKTLLVEPLLQLRDLERFVLQTTPFEDANYIEWCQGLVGKFLAERPIDAASLFGAGGDAEGRSEGWRKAKVTSFSLEAKLPVHSLRYVDDDTEVKLLLHLREVVVLQEARSSDPPQGESTLDDVSAPDGYEEPAAATADTSDQEAVELTASPSSGEEAAAAAGATEEQPAQEAAPEEQVHKLLVNMPMVQAGEIPFEMVWGDLLEAGEAVLLASPSGTWQALGWKDRAELETSLRAGLEARGVGTLARGLTREQAEGLLERMDELADAMYVEVDRQDVPQPTTRPGEDKKPLHPSGPICRRVQLELDRGSAPVVGVAVWEHHSGALDVVDQQGRFLSDVPASKVAPSSRRARHSPGRAMPLELSVLGLSSGSSAGSQAGATGSRGPGSGGFEWQFQGDDGWCRYDAAASNLLESARERGEDTVTVRSGSSRYLVDLRAGTQMNMVDPGRRVRNVRRLTSSGGSQAGGGSSSSSARAPPQPALERNFSALDRGPVHDFQHKVLERKLGEEHFRPQPPEQADEEEETSAVPTSPSGARRNLLAELARGEHAPRLRVHFFRTCSADAGDDGTESKAQLAREGSSSSSAAGRKESCTADEENPALPLGSTVLQALLLPEPAARRRVEQRLRFAVRLQHPHGNCSLEQSAEVAPPLACLELRRACTGVQAAGDAGAEGESATLLALLRKLRRRRGVSTGWENSQLNRKLAHQLAQPLLTAAGVAPAWVEAMPLAYPFLFQRRLREQLLHCVGFGTSHAVLWLQRQSVEERFGDRLRLARERLARTGNDAELWEIHEQAAADESVFVGAGRSEMARLPGRSNGGLLDLAERVVELTYRSRAVLEVVFDDETGFGDGVTQSFYSDVAAELCSVDCEGVASGLWAEHLPQSRIEYGGKTSLHSRRGLFPQPHVPGSPASLEACKRFRFLGRLMAKALRDGFIVPLPICKHFFEAVLGEDLSLEALPSPGDGWAGEFLGAAARFAAELRSSAATVDERSKEAAKPAWAESYMRASGEAGAVSFNEYAEHCSFLETGSSGMELCEGGADRALRIENLEDFVECAAQWWLRDGIAPQVEAFRLGVQDVCDSPAIWAFEALELQELLCGSAAPEWSAQELKQHLKPRGGYSAASQQVSMLIEELVRMPLERRGQFLEFVTACPRLPHGGLASAEIVVVPAQPKGSLPRAHTCTNELQLPAFATVEELSEKLAEAIDCARGMYE
eukprot:TRINITY_DN16480_c0_g1_i1.p1 TRINITY_DN16480_c0_g1~~TRINITY_DN16480_c0_g1_i1.p1  ORF type:complete len:2502 (+),score=638.39 TRINITY_DN16480_c0_g1_i1:480-7508(+)